VQRCARTGDEQAAETLDARLGVRRCARTGDEQAAETLDARLGVRRCARTRAGGCVASRALGREGPGCDAEGFDGPWGVA